MGVLDGTQQVASSAGSRRGDANGADHNAGL